VQSQGNVLLVVGEKLWDAEVLNLDALGLLTYSDRQYMAA
jgi:hypothetical protein